MSTSANEIDPATPTSTSRVSEYWAKQSEEARTSRSVWINNEIVARHVYRLISGGMPLHWLSWFFQHYLSPAVTFKKSLSICCGEGTHEIALYRTGTVHSIHGFDISEGAIASAKAKFEEAAVSPGRYCFEVADANDLQLEGQFDLCLSTGALHHVTNLEGLLSHVADALTADGYFVVLEFIGPNRFQWTDQQLELINGILRRLETRYLKDNKRIQLQRAPVDAVIANDPSEAVRSEEVLPMLNRYFTVEYLKYFNGAIVHPLYPLLNPEFTNSGSADFDSIIRLILFLEEVLVREKVLPSDFAFAICRRRDFKQRENRVR